MKKVFSTMVLTAIIAGMAWAQDEGTIKIAGGELTISGDAKFGVSVDGTTRKPGGLADGDDSTTGGIYFYSDDVGINREGKFVGSRFDLGFSYVNGPVGTKVSFRLNDFSAPDVATVFHNAYAFVNLFGGKINVTGGKINDAIWGSTMITDSDTDDSYTGYGVTGFRLAIQPIAGLSFGAAWDLATPTLYGGSGKDLTAGPNNNGAGGATQGRVITPGAFFGNTRFGIIYSNDAFGAATLELKLNGSKYSAAKEENVGQGADILYGVRVTAIPKLALTLDGYFENLFAAKNSDLIKDGYGVSTPSTVYWLFSLRGDYHISDPLMVGLKVILDGSGTTETESEVKEATDEMNVSARVFGYYDITQIINVGAEIGLKIDGAPKTTKDSAAWKAADYSEFQKIWIKPKATFTLSEGLSFVVFDQIDLIMANWWADENAYLTKVGGDRAGYVNNKFQLDFVWTF